eukprot:TRINITY_DN1303_c0_g1_i1.p1 TRINITY_DN1303_c0_g1~~TRINITY_DN1303_c0_g1_i1.p1  ORF type:complete len:255 (+),score=65.63 TRINITY_DN1303_c0_g1_i1:18-782(+)
MPILYAVVARGTVVLAEYAAKTGNIDKVVKKLLEKIPSADGRMSYVFESHYFHYVVEDGITYLCMAEESFGRRIPFAFLEDVKNRFKVTYGARAKSAVAFTMQADFAKTLQNLTEYYSNTQNSDKITKLKGELDEVKNVMVTNIEKVLERGEKIELLVDKTDQLNQTSVNFRKKATQLKRSMWWKNVKLTIMIILILIVVVYIIVAISCGGLLFQGCVGSDTPSDPNTPAGAPGTVAPTAASGFLLPFFRNALN